MVNKCCYLFIYYTTCSTTPTP